MSTAYKCTVRATVQPLILEHPMNSRRGHGVFPREQSYGVHSIVQYRCTVRYKEWVSGYQRPLDVVVQNFP